MHRTRSGTVTRATRDGRRGRGARGIGDRVVGGIAVRFARHSPNDRRDDPALYRVRSGHRTLGAEGRLGSCHFTTTTSARAVREEDRPPRPPDRPPVLSRPRPPRKTVAASTLAAVHHPRSAPAPEVRSDTRSGPPCKSTLPRCALRTWSRSVPERASLPAARCRARLPRFDPGSRPPQHHGCHPAAKPTGSTSRSTALRQRTHRRTRSWW